MLKGRKALGFTRYHPYSENKKTLLSVLFSFIDSASFPPRLTKERGGVR